MNKEAPPVSTPKLKRIGILLSNLQGVNVSALKFLLVQLNVRATSFEYELLPCDSDDEFIKMLSSKSPVDREKTRAGVVAFLDRYRTYLNQQIKSYKLKEESPDYFVLVTLVHFSDEYYSMRQGGLSILALGNWERRMAPPSILEFVLTLVLRESVASISKSLRTSVHLGTKGCLFDFTLYLEEARFKVLQGFVCDHCRKALEQDSYPGLADELTNVLSKDWLGKSTDAGSPAGIVSNLGFDLFLTKGLKPSAWESFLSTIQQEGVKELLKLIGGLILAGLIVWMGFKK